MNEVKQECLRLFNNGLKPKEIYDKYYSTMSNSSLSSFRRMLRMWKKDDQSKIQGTVKQNDIDIIEVLKKGILKSELEKLLMVSSDTCDEILEDVRHQGYNVQDSGKDVKISTIVIPTDNRITHAWGGDKVIRFALMGDTQINSKYTQITHLHTFYEHCKREGITVIYHTGDIDDGEKMRPGHEYELYNHGADDHVNEIVRVYPQINDIYTYFITGNHDAAYVKLCGLDIGQKIAEKRPDMKYLGYMSAAIDLTPNCQLELRHPIDGTAYAISYKIQKMVESMNDNQKPQILAVGHYHKAEYFPYMSVQCFQTGCLQMQSNWMRGKNIAAYMGGWIVEAHVNDSGELVSITPRFIPFDIPIKDDWKNWR